ncbi:hypothetical protein pipiens_016855 [Culex pipiens pipiens]|uniref:Uncharacterized protein n=1 Tax=Culex pipiens pipiens TaxID=38569 RepID=A0ABD1CJE9_CULPP
MLRLLEVDHPAAKVHFKLAKLQNEIFGDRTICIAAELLKNKNAAKDVTNLMTIVTIATILFNPTVGNTELWLFQDGDGQSWQRLA